MALRTIELDEDAYNRLLAEKRDGESFSDTVRRIASESGPSESSTDWRDSLGKYSSEKAEVFVEAVEGDSLRS